MPTTIELVRFEVPTERRAELVAGHAAARRAMTVLSPPGAIWSRLLKLGERDWLEIVAWPERAVFERTLARAPEDPVAGAWFRLAEPGSTVLRLGTPEGGSIAPPEEGVLELTWISADPDLNPVDGGWSLTVELEGRAFLDDSGWVEREPALVSVTAGSSDPIEAGDTFPSGPTRERAVIAHAVDSDARHGT